MPRVFSKSELKQIQQAKDLERRVEQVARRLGTRDDRPARRRHHDEEAEGV